MDTEAEGERADPTVTCCGEGDDRLVKRVIRFKIVELELAPPQE